MKHLTTARNLALFGALGAIIGLWSATRTWITVDVQSSTVQIPQIVVDGASAAPAITAVSIAVLAGSLALLIAGKIARYIIGAICLLAGVAVVASGAAAMANPQTASFAAVSKATGLAQNAGDYTVTFWPTIAVIGGVLIVLQAVLVLVFSRSWAVKADKYARETGSKAAAPKDASSRNIADWEQFSAGEDPTEGQKD
ncbi:Trp biosynthesis-associated membrane protein [Glutamicibacter sp.]|uniref:Trp biosynthesis-associated membrane protein n=1 Tax=Glutamicibacter sp. TaxID=1931995 RepID=UPI0028BE3927|nr:Trp biosynthesis-associated membrane protein [Glutamicibacter sp.]